jgi:NAD-dependent deacetylase
MESQIITLHKWVQESGNIVFFGGAGVSTESGIPDFRGVDGLYAQKFKYPPEVMLSRSFFNKRPGEFFAFYRDKLLPEGIRPNRAHEVLAQWETQGKLKAVITQNIDGLHQAAGSKNVLELHGAVARNYCLECKAVYGVEKIKVPEVNVNDAIINEATPQPMTDWVPRCQCGGIIKPDVVLFEEPLRDDVMQRAAEFVAQADMLIVGGTSLSVYPAAGLVNLYRGNKLVLINQGATAYDKLADLIIREKIGAVLSAVF